MLGFPPGYPPKFARKYADAHAVIPGAVGAYAADVRDGRFPDEATSFHLKPEVAAELRSGKVRTPKRGKRT